MKRIVFAWAWVAVAGFVGCNPTSEPVANMPTEVTGEQGHAHDHDLGPDHGAGTRDHSLEGHAHGAGPHDGTIADWGGGKYHVEFTVDHDQQQATVYILGSDEQTPTPIDAASIELSIKEPEMQVVLQALPQAGDPQGKSSRFVGTDEKLGVVQEYVGTMTGVVDGTPYSGDFSEEAHAAHEH